MELRAWHMPSKCFATMPHHSLKQYNLYFSFTCMGVLPASVACSVLGGQKRALDQFPGGCWELNSGPLEGHKCSYQLTCQLSPPLLLILCMGVYPTCMCALCACSNGMTCRHSSGSNDGTRACGETTPAGKEPRFRNKPPGVRSQDGHGSGESFLAFLSSRCN